MGCGCGCDSAARNALVSVESFAWKFMGVGELSCVYPYGLTSFPVPLSVPTDVAVEALGA